MPWHLPWKLNLLNCCLESHTSINWRGSVDIWLSDISRRDGLLQPWQHGARMACWRRQNNHCDILWSYYRNSSYQMYNSEPRHRDRCHKLISNPLVSHCSKRVCPRGLHKSYLLLLSALQIPPLLRYVAEVHLVHGHLDVADGIVFGEAVEIVHRHHQRLSSELDVGDLSARKGRASACTGCLNDVSHPGFMSWIRILINSP